MDLIGFETFFAGVEDVLNTVGIDARASLFLAGAVDVTRCVRPEFTEFCVYS